MIRLSNAFRRHLYDNERNYVNYADIVLADGTKLNLTDTELWSGGFNTEDAVSEDDSFTALGSAVIGSGSITINNMDESYSDYDFTDAEVTLYTGMVLPDGDGTRLEKIQKGVYTVDDPSYNGGVINLSLLDNMEKFDRPYSDSSLVYPATIDTIIRDACTCCGVQLATTTIPHADYTASVRPADESTTFREVISWAAAIAGCFCRMNRFGKLEVTWFDQALLESVKADIDGGVFDSANPYATGATVYGGIFNPWDDGTAADEGNFSEERKLHYIGGLSSQNIGVDDVVITGVRVVVKTESDDQDDATKTFLSGSTGYVIQIEDNPLITVDTAQEVCGWLGAQLNGMTFRKAGFDHLSDPSIEAGDVALLFDRKGRQYPILVTRTSFSPDSMQSTVCGAETPSRNRATQYSAATKAYVEARKMLRHEKTTREMALEDLSNKLAEKAGLYMSTVSGDSGTIYYLHDKPQLADSSTVWKMTADAWGVTDDYKGDDTEWNAGMTVDGNLIAKILDAIGVNAEWIRTGQLSVSKNGKEVLFVDVDTGTVRIVADSFSLGSQSIGDIAQAKVDGQTAKSILKILDASSDAMYLSNGKLYVKASAVLSGILKLGGYNNQNGLLQVFNSSGTKVGQWDNTGISLANGKFTADVNGKCTAKDIEAYGSFICYENA